MRMFIDNLLDFSRISRVKEPFTSVDLNVILKQVKSDFEILIEETNTTITSGKLPITEGNPAQLKQLMANIISNAIKFRRQGVKPEIEITLKEVSGAEKMKFALEDKAYFKISICDNGIGFEAEYAERIFEVFERLHGKSEYPGTGIGLAICQKIAAYHGGALFAENNTGNGACFYIILPASQD
jgi:signal transduction histidine kinase